MASNARENIKQNITLIEKLRDAVASLEQELSRLKGERTKINLGLENSKDARIIALLEEDLVGLTKQINSVRGTLGHMKKDLPVIAESMDKILHGKGRVKNTVIEGVSEDVNRLIVRLDRALNLIKTTQGLGTGVRPVRPEAPFASDDPAQTTKNLFLLEQMEKHLDMLAKKARLSRDELNKLQGTLANPKYADALKKAEAAGFAATDLYRIQSKGTTGVQQLSFFNRTETGARNQADFMVSPTGGAIPVLSKQYRTFTQGVVRDIGELAKWSIALSVIYGPLNKLSELMSAMIANEVKLADANIAINNSLVDAGQIFDTAYQSANQFGEAIGGVIDAYTQAYRATGQYETSLERTDKASSLLNDALTLSKLSALDQAESIDTLTAALRQMGLGLDQGGELLNKWVKVTQIANVDLATLATGVAVLGDAAETAGLDIDELNALVATLAETSIASAKETANVSKALIGAYQTERAEQAFSRIGVSVRNANGDVREFMDVIRDISDLYKKDLLTESQFGEIALAGGGGGTRRAKDFAALVSNMDRYNQIRQQSALVTADSNEAEAALAKRLDTVQTAITRVANAFQSLAQTLGEEGGLLEVIKNLANFMANLVEFIDKLVAASGRSGPILALVGALTAMMTIGKSETQRAAIAASFPGAGLLYQQKGLLSGTFAGAGKDITSIFGQREMVTPKQTLDQYVKGVQPQPVPGAFQWTPRFAPIAERAKEITSGARGISTALGLDTGLIKQTAAVAALTAVGQFASGGFEGDKKANAYGSVIGAAIGTALTGSPVGGLVGASIADAFVSKTITYDVQFSNFFKEVIGGAVEGAGGEKPKLSPEDEAARQAFIEYSKYVESERQKVPGNRPYEASVESGKFNASIDAFFMNLGQWMNSGRWGTATPERVAYLEASPELKQKIDALGKVIQIQAGEAGIVSPLTEKQAGFAERDSAYLEKIKEQRRKDLLSQVSAQEIKPAEYARRVEDISGFETKATRQMAAFGAEFIKLNRSVNTTEKAYQAFLDVASYGSADLSEYITTIVTDINALSSAIADAKEASGVLPITLTIMGKEQTFSTLDELQARKDELAQFGAQVQFQAFTDQLVQRVQLPSIVGSVTEPRTAQDTKKIEDRARQLQLKFYDEMGLAGDQAKLFAQSLEDFTVLVGDAGKNHFEVMKEIDQQFWSAAQEQLEKAGEIATQQGGFGFQKFDVDRATLEMLSKQSIAMGQQWANQFPGFETNPEDLLAITNEGTVKPIHADLKILALLLEQLNDKAQKQLDGMYNIPEGATFWVPLTAAYYRPQAEGGVDLSSLDTSGLDTSADNLDDAASALIDAADALKGTSKDELPEQIKRAKDLGEKAKALEAAKEPEKPVSPTAGLNLPPNYGEMVQAKEAPSELPTFSDNILQRLFDFISKTPQLQPESPEYILKFLEPIIGKLYPETKQPEVQQPQLQAEQAPTIIDELFAPIIELFKSVFSQEAQQPNVGGGKVLPMPAPIMPPSTADTKPTITTKLDMSFDSTVQLVVDGRVLANIVKMYLASDMISTEQTQSAITKRYVI